MSGMLYLVATPIGNLEDMTFRAIRTLKEVDIIAAEDTRNSIHLLNHYEIHTPMTSYHEYNKYDKARTLVEKMRGGATVAVITDAGTPGISDPGEELVKQCMEAGIPVTSVPGACACVNALVSSGLPTRRFAFEAFLPADKKERRRILEGLKTETRTIVLYEAPHHLKGTLKELYDTLGGERRITLARELTKKHETILSLTLEESLIYYQSNEPRGEYVLVLEGIDEAVLAKQSQEQYLAMSLQEHMDYYEKQGLDSKAAMKKVAADRGVSKREIYNALLEEKHTEGDSN